MDCLLLSCAKHCNKITNNNKTKRNNLDCIVQTCSQWCLSYFMDEMVMNGTEYFPREQMNLINFGGELPPSSTYASFCLSGIQKISQTFKANSYLINHEVNPLYIKLIWRKGPWFQQVSTPISQTAKVSGKKEFTPFPL